LNWWRNIDRSWELLAPFVRVKVTIPALYMAGDRDFCSRSLFPVHYGAVSNGSQGPADDDAAGLRTLDRAKNVRRRSAPP
jgi:hypothetical protein